MSQRQMLEGAVASNFPQRVKPQHTREEWLEKIRTHGMTCHYCECELTVAILVKEHLRPLCREGSDRIANIVPSCIDCNQMKAWRTEDEFFRDREKLLARRTVCRGIGKPKPVQFSLEAQNEPGLLKRLNDERERISWAWKNPA